jgi:hypothetical protein
MASDVADTINRLNTRLWEINKRIDEAERAKARTDDQEFRLARHKHQDRTRSLGSKERCQTSRRPAHASERIRSPGGVALLN